MPSTLSVKSLLVVGFHTDGRCTFGITSRRARDRANIDRAHLSSDKQLPGVGAQSAFDRFRDGLPNMTGSEIRNRLPGRNEGSDPTRAPEAELMDTMARLQLEMEALKFGPLVVTRHWVDRLRWFGLN